MSLRTGWGSIVKSAKCNFHLLALHSGADQSLVCYFHAQYKTHECTQPKHDLIAQVSQFHCLDLMFALILPGSSEITCRPGRYRGCSAQHVALI